MRHPPPPYKQKPDTMASWENAHADEEKPSFIKTLYCWKAGRRVKVSTNCILESIVPYITADMVRLKVLLHGFVAQHCELSKLARANLTDQQLPFPLKHLFCHAMLKVGAFIKETRVKPHMISFCIF